MESRFPASWSYRVRAKFFAPADQIAVGISPADGLVEAIDDHTSVVTFGGSDPVLIAAFLCMFSVDFQVLEPGPVAATLHTVANRCRSALASVGPFGL